jgi:drug/metabolite transporter (DMT)-like permease
LADLITLVWAVLGAAAFALVFFAKNWATTNPPEPFNWPKFISTLIIGAAIGFTFWLSGFSITQDGIIDQLTDYAAATAVIEAILKAVVAKLGWTWPGNTTIMQKPSASTPNSS